ncbi:hypothetical protein [Mucilaginibacter sp. UR6-11]|uniref:hypothetical protein n=1 Tax=Mucilaginibacter sp. UR6-11 TaxID=1435644 RepID=UPI001E574F00|nr:hypothetical protein [Mucilaginibacter sp. UR6-11]MCC8425468.1 hypothetical protein [Mucilaginibacter sp. UR6-11]
MNSNFSKIDALRTTQLQVTRSGLFKPVYTLTDGQFTYGQISCGDYLGRKMNIDTASGSWLIKQIGFLGKQIQIIDKSKAEVIGRITKNIWETKTLLEMNDGFSALLKKGPGFFSRELNWANDQYGECIKIISTCKCTTPFNITIDDRLPKTTAPVALIILIGINLVLQRQAQAAAVA